MKVEIIERLRDESKCAGKFIKHLVIICPGCKKEIIFEFSILGCCTALFCSYCHNYFSVNEIINKIEKV